MRSALILTASFGEGHNAAARNLHAALRKVAPECESRVSDVFLDAYGRLNAFAERAYLTVINRAPGIWRGLFQILDRTRLVELHMPLYRAAAVHLHRLIEETRPDLIISTYPGCGHLLDRMFHGRKRPFKTLTVITDSITINSVWYRAHSDFFIVANFASQRVLIEGGVQADKVLDLGFPVPLRFADLSSEKSVPADDFWRLLYVVNSGRHLAPRIVAALLGIERIRLAVTVGRDEALRSRIEKVSRAMGKRVEMYGWTDEMPQLMAASHLLLGKAGGATVQESLAARTPMLITQIVPGQEEGNARLILENQAGAHANSPDLIASAAREAFSQGGAQWKRWYKAACALSRPSAALDIARFAVELSARPAYVPK